MIVVIPQESRVGDHESVETEAPEIKMIAEVDPLHGGRRGELGAVDLFEQLRMILILVGQRRRTEIGHRRDEVPLRRIEDLEERRRVFLYLLIGKIADHLDARHAYDGAAGIFQLFGKMPAAHIFRAEKGRLLQREGDEDERVIRFSVL